MIAYLCVVQKPARVANVSIEAISVMADVNAMGAHPLGQSILLVAHVTHDTPTVLELRKQ